MKKIKFAKKLHGNIKVVKIARHENMENFKNYCLRYGTIINDSSYEAAEGYYKGFNRNYEVFVDGLLCTIRMNNGEVKGIGWGTCNKYNIEKITEVVNRQA